LYLDQHLRFGKLMSPPDRTAMPAPAWSTPFRYHSLLTVGHTKKKEKKKHPGTDPQKWKISTPI